jgi:hypothetical protein
MIPTVTIRASATILNGECYFPVRGFVESGEPEDVQIVETCKLTLDHLGAAVLFKGSGITLFIENEAKLRAGQYGWLDHFVNYLIYKVLREVVWVTFTALGAYR